LRYWLFSCSFTQLGKVFTYQFIYSLSEVVELGGFSSVASPGASCWAFSKEVKTIGGLKSAFGHASCKFKYSAQVIVSSCPALLPPRKFICTSASGLGSPSGPVIPQQMAETLLGSAIR